MNFSCDGKLPQVFFPAKTVMLRMEKISSTAFRLMEQLISDGNLDGVGEYKKSTPIFSVLGSVFPTPIFFASLKGNCKRCWGPPKITIFQSVTKS